MDLEELKDRAKSLRTKEGLKQNWFFLAVPAVFILALYIRYMPAEGMKYLQALDPYWIFRQSQHLALEGFVPEVDFMRYFPYNAPFHYFNVGEIYLPAILYWLGPFMFFGSYLEWAQFFPALMGASGVVVMYFLGKELFDRLTGISAAFFLATIPGVLHRTSAGFFEKEPVGTFFMLLSLYFFTRGWKRKQQWAGVVSGIALGFFTISWGGSKMLWLLYPLAVGIMMWLNEDIESLVAVYTPTVLIGGSLASILNPSRFWFTGSVFIANLALLGFLWSRYLVEELELLKEKQLGYYVPTVSILGLVALVLSPLYSNFIASKFIGVVNTVSRGGGGGVIGGTVAENQAASLGQLVGQLGAASAQNFGGVVPFPGSSVIGTAFGMLGNLNGAWTLAFVGIIVLGTKMAAMVLQKVDVLPESIQERDYYKILLILTLVWTGVFSYFFASSIMLAVAPAILGIAGGLGILYAMEEFKRLEIEMEWYHILPLAWVITNILAAVTSSRLIFLAAFPVALMAGYTFSKVIKRLSILRKDSTLYLSISGLLLVLDLFLILLISPVLGLPISAALVLSANALLYLFYPEDWDPEKVVERKDAVKIGLITVVVVLTVLVNFSAGYSSANSLGGSPNQLWMDNLEYMSEETPEGSAILSWWDYGYWFQSIGERTSVADGGNNNYYTSGQKINLPLADFLTSDNPNNHTDFLRKHSTDYIVLDQTMIGKYSAVSQISNRDNENFNSMLQVQTSRDIRNSLDDNQSLLTASSRGVTVYAPLDRSEEGVELSTDPENKPNLEIQSRRGVVRNEIGCIVTEDGVVEYENVSDPAKLQQGEVCLAENPYYSIERALLGLQAGQAVQAQLVLVPKEIVDSTLVKLYLMDGHGIDFVEKVEEGSNGFVKMWEVKDLEE